MLAAVRPRRSRPPAAAARRQTTSAGAPIVEVAVLFAGIFVDDGAGARHPRGPRSTALGGWRAWQYFWATGMLSCFLDNAPTYLTFAVAVRAAASCGSERRRPRALLNHPGGESFLAAISCGAVFMGANTYIGNGPNFMVKAIAEESGVQMPSFFGYMAWIGAILIPVFVLVTMLLF